MADADQRKHVFVDVEITRRKHFHLVGDWPPWVEADWRSRLFGDIVLWLADRDEAEYYLHVGDRTFLVQMSEVDVSKGEHQWQNSPDL